MDGFANPIIIFADAHIHPHKKSIERLYDCLKSVEWVFDTAAKYGIKDIVFAGDLYQDRQHIDVMTYHLTFQAIQNRIAKDKVKLWLLLGNHDLWYYDKWDISSVSPFSAIDGVTVVDHPQTIEINGTPIDFLPYTHDPINHLKELRSVPTPGKKILVGHLAVDGAKLNIIHNTHSDVIIEHDNEMVVVGADSFKGWDHVFLGHYHAAQNLSESVEYVGSPLQLTFNEAFQAKHIIIFDVITGKKKYVVNDFSPKHLILTADEVKNADLKNNFIRVTVNQFSSIDRLELKNEIDEQCPGTLEIIDSDDNAPEHLVEDAKSILQEEDKMLEIYVSKCDIGNLDKDYLLDWGRKVCKEAQIKMTP